MKAVVYARISRDEQSKYSIGEQVQLCQKLMEAEGHEVVDVFIDEGFSSKTMKRPALQSMLSQIKSKKFEIICVWNSDRLTRTTLDGLIMVTTMFKPSGIEFASVTEDIDTSTPDGMMMFTIRLSMAQRERERIAERSSMGQAARARKGLRNSSTRPYGYDIGKDLSLTINEEEAVTVRLVFDWFLQGWGRIKIARTLNDNGIPAKGGGLWYESVITDMLINPTYIGATHYKPKNDPEEKRIIVHNMHELIISPAAFEEVKSNLKRRKEQHMSTSSYDFPFSTVLKCGECGRSYHGKKMSFNGTRNEIRIYRCSGKYRVNPCKSGSDLSELKLSRLFLAFLDRFDIETETPNKPAEGVDVEREIKRLAKLIEESANKRKNYARAMGAGKLEFTTFEELVDEENQKSKAWLSDLDALKAVKPSKAKLTDVAGYINTLRKNWDKLSHEDRKYWVQKLFNVIVVKKTGREWEIVWFKLADL